MPSEQWKNSTEVLFHKPKLINFQNEREFFEFNVNGRYHKGRVRIEIDRGLDLFNVSLLRARKEEVLYETKGIYLDCLVDTIDNLIETSSYKNK